MDFELEWYDNIRAGNKPICDKCNRNIDHDDFHERRNQRGVYCERCWNWIHLQTHTDSKGNKYTLRSERRIEVWPQ